MHSKTFMISLIAAGPPDHRVGLGRAPEIALQLDLDVEPGVAQGPDDHVGAHPDRPRHVAHRVGEAEVALGVGVGVDDGLARADEHVERVGDAVAVAVVGRGHRPDPEVGGGEQRRQLGAIARTGPYVAQAPLAIIVAIEPTAYAVSDGSRAIHSMILTAWTEGVGSNWVGFQGMTGVKTLLSIPETLDVLAVLSFGYPAQAIGQGKKERKPLEEVAHRERFGQPFV